MMNLDFELVGKTITGVVATRVCITDCAQAVDQSYRWSQKSHERLF